MGIFSLSGNSAVQRTDLVWLTQAAKLKGTLDYLAKNRTDMCIAWFEETYRAYKQFVNEENQVTIEITLAESLAPYHLNDKNAVFLEHYPLYAKEANLLSEMKAANVCFMNSLDDAIFQLFGGNIAQMMRGMGLEEGQYIENKMVSSAVMRAQKKVEKNNRDVFYARSGSEWLEQYRTFSQQRRR
jgi:hypothetical protein